MCDKMFYSKRYIYILAYFQIQFIHQCDFYNYCRQADLCGVHNIFLRHFEISHHWGIKCRVDFKKSIIQHHSRFSILVIVIFVYFFWSGYSCIQHFYANLKKFKIKRLLSTHLQKKLIFFFYSILYFDLKMLNIQNNTSLTYLYIIIYYI